MGAGAQAAAGAAQVARLRSRPALIRIVPGSPCSPSADELGSSSHGSHLVGTSNSSIMALDAILGSNAEGDLARQMVHGSMAYTYILLL
jgi:hypothetical protein